MSRSRDLDAPAEIDSFGRSQATLAGRRQRVPAQSTKERGLPYQRPTSAPAATLNKWDHDLFTPLSSLYTPSINPAALKGVKQGTRPVSSSLRPFGSLTPESDTLQLDPRASKHDPARAPSSAASIVGPTAVSVQGQSAKVKERERERERQQKQQQDKIRRAERKRKIEDRQRLEKEHAEQSRIAEQEDKGSVVQVEGLVTGTSAEDTAFGAYGETSFCFIANENSGNDLIARLTFKRYEDANQACIKLNGAIADGKPLTVKMVNRTPFPPPLPPFELEPAPKPTQLEEAPRRRMYADEVEAVDPRYSGPVAIQVDEDVSMDVEPQVPVTSNGRQRRREGRPTLGSNERAPSAPAAVPSSGSTSLLSRFGGLPNARDGGAKHSGTASAQQSQPNSFGRSLLDRLAPAGGRSPKASGGTSGGGGKGKSTGNSLAGRIK
ncbi:hypothetical protein OIV83_000868 [Microbotryomycetes sp. JL201]|nr:hypothetical protein OIV83_000868 [Microbotryomycetes sp. JL201]